MRLVAADPPQQQVDPEIETVPLSAAQLEFIDRLSRDIDPAMPLAFGSAHAVRTLLERLEEAQLDLSSASSEDEITSVAAAALRARKRRAGR